MIKVLLDNSAYKKAAIEISVMTPKVVNWGGNDHVFQVSQVQRAKHMLEQREQMQAYQDIINQVRIGRVQLFTYSELLHESWNAADPRYIGAKHLLDGITLHHIDPAVERSRFQQMEFGKYICIKNGKKKSDKRSKMIEFCELLRGLNEDVVSQLLEIPYFNFSQQEKDNLTSQRFRELAQSLATHQLPDAFHLWSAEVAGLDYFLSFDGKFVRAMTMSSKLNLPCKPVLPITLLQILYTIL